MPLSTNENDEIESEQPETEATESVKESLSKAFEQAEGREGFSDGDDAPIEAAQTEVEPAAGAPAESVTEKAARARARDDKGKFTKAEQAAQDAKAKEGAQEPAAATPEAAKPGQQAQPVKPAGEALKAPQSWSPAEREAFAKADPVVQRAALRRETEITKTLNESAFSRKGFETIQRIVDPHMGLLRATGMNPYQAIEGFFRTAQILTNGPAHTKADEIARLISQSLPGAEGLKTLDAALNRIYGGAAPTGTDTHAQPQEFRDPRFDKFINDLEAQKAALQQQQHAQLVDGYAKFAETHEYFHDVKEDMAELIASKARRGIVLDDEQAYALALKLNPEIDAIVQQRAAAAAARKGNPSIARSRAAASSIRGTPVGARTAPQPDDVRGSVEAAIARLEGGGR